MVSAVGAAHALGIIHRDLKPDNVFLARQPDGSELVKVLDFGTAKLANATFGKPHLTRTGAAIGNPCYMAPEQALGVRQIDHRVDVWAIGVLLYECLSGIRPIEGKSLVDVIKGTSKYRDFAAGPSGSGSAAGRGSRRQSLAGARSGRAARRSRGSRPDHRAI